MLFIVAEFLREHRTYSAVDMCAAGVGRGGGILHLRSTVARATPRPLNGTSLCSRDSFSDEMCAVHYSRDSMRKPRRLVLLAVWSTLAALMLLLGVRSYVRSDNITYGRQQVIERPERPDIGSVGFNVGGFVCCSEGLLFLGYAEPPQPSLDESRSPSRMMWDSFPSPDAPLIPRGGAPDSVFISHGDGNTLRVRGPTQNQHSSAFPSGSSLSRAASRPLRVCSWYCANGDARVRDCVATVDTTCESPANAALNAVSCPRPDPSKCRITPAGADAAAVYFTCDRPSRVPAAAAA